MNNLKVLFVDIDDVFLMHKGPNQCLPYPHNLETSTDYQKALKFYYPQFDKEHIKRLMILTSLSVKIIIHSSWRNFCDLKDFQLFFEHHGVNKDDIIDVCPCFFSESKRRGIAAKLNDYKPSHYAIIDDDDSIFGKENQNFIFINPYKGFDEDALNNVKAILHL